VLGGGQPGVTSDPSVTSDTSATSDPKVTADDGPIISEAARGGTGDTRGAGDGGSTVRVSNFVCNLCMHPVAPLVCTVVVKEAELMT
jgi:hypothetical protein